LEESSERKFLPQSAFRALIPKGYRAGLPRNIIGPWILSGTRKLVKDEKEKIDDLLASAIDRDQAILMQAEFVDESLGRVANLDSQCDSIRNDAKRSADMLNRVHERLKLIEAAIDDSSGEGSERAFSACA
jgi:hypothetical protein